MAESGAGWKFRCLLSSHAMPVRQKTRVQVESTVILFIRESLKPGAFKAGSIKLATHRHTSLTLSCEKTFALRTLDT